MTKIKHHCIHFVLFCAALCPTWAEEIQKDPPGYQLVVNASTGESRLDRSTIRRILLGKIKNWEDGRAVQLVIYREHELQNTFVRELASKSPQSFFIYWKKMIFSGKGSAPRKVITETEMLNLIKNTKGAIGFVSAGTELRPGIKALRISE